MARYQQQKFVAEVRAHFPKFFEGTKVLEVGSWIVNDTVRSHFGACDYVGTDVAEGPGVDVAVVGQDLAFPTGAFDVVISCECFEHNPFWLATFLNMARMLRPGGLFVFTCAGIGRGEHGTNRRFPSGSLTAAAGHQDYYCNLSQRDFERRVPLANHFSDYAFIDNRYAKDLYFFGPNIAPRPTRQMREGSRHCGRRRVISPCRPAGPSRRRGVSASTQSGG
jgi:SAM-dependent methyltransferase